MRNEWRPVSDVWWHWKPILAPAHALYIWISPPCSARPTLQRGTRTTEARITQRGEYRQFDKIWQDLTRRNIKIQFNLTAAANDLRCMVRISYAAEERNRSTSRVHASHKSKNTPCKKCLVDIIVLCWCLSKNLSSLEAYPTWNNPVRNPPTLWNYRAGTLPFFPFRQVRFKRL